MGKEIIGHMDCPECGRAGAQIKLQKNGRPYRFCADGCQAQFFARNDEQEKAMRTAMVPVTGTGPEAEEMPATQPVTATARKGFSLGGLA